MADFYSKFLELVNIKTINDQTYLQIKLYYEQEIELLWKIDHETALNIRKQINFDEKHKYRLSLHPAFDTINKKYISVITKTYREHSDKLYFTCSLNYKNELDSIKAIQSIQELDLLPFLSTNLLIENKLEEVLDNSHHHKKNHKKFSYLYKWTSVAIIIVLLFALYGYNSDQIFEKNSTIETTVPKVEAKTINVNVEKEKIESKDDSIVKNKVITQPEVAIPSIDVHDYKTFSLPEGYVALTFDDGPSKYTTQIADILKEYKVGGTFFFIGTNARQYPEHLKYVQSTGFSIGSHSMHHSNMAKLTYDQQLNEIQQSINVIEEIAGQDINLFRPPFEAFNDQTEVIIQENNYNMILWNIDPKDWKTRDADSIYQDVISEDLSGSIILLHESQAVIDALPRIIDYLLEHGLIIVNLK